MERNIGTCLIQTGVSLSENVNTQMNDLAKHIA